MTSSLQKPAYRSTLLSRHKFQRHPFKFSNNHCCSKRKELCAAYGQDCIINLCTKKAVKCSLIFLNENENENENDSNSARE